MRIGAVLLLALISALSAMPASAQPADGGEADQGGMVITGTLEELDLARMKGRLKTDLGKPIFFTVVKPQLFERLSVGQHVTIQLDPEGRATKVMDTPVPELKHPLPLQ